jgi:two-component system cell cycle response regulator DivK
MDRRRSRNPPTRPLVLIIEGHEDTRELYALALSANGFEVETMADGAEACGRAWELHPDAIVTDLPMPNYDGWEFLRDLRRDPRTRNIPVVAVSGHVQRSVREQAERDGFAAFLPKPCLPDELADGLRQVLDGKALHLSSDHDSTKRYLYETDSASRVGRPAEVKREWCLERSPADRPPKRHA